IKVPFGCYARFAPHSSLAIKHDICIGAGVGDAKYTENASILVVAQLVGECICYPQVKEVPGLPSTDKGAQRYGSSGTDLTKCFVLALQVYPRGPHMQ
ncbi:DUT nucleotidohydrolase, partial [Polyodon spathula]|nr:DUT nucleotidohydrolase [Polyodon spathula]